MSSVLFLTLLGFTVAITQDCTPSQNVVQCCNKASVTCLNGTPKCCGIYGEYVCYTGDDTICGCKENPQFMPQCSDEVPVLKCCDPSTAPPFGTCPNNLSKCCGLTGKFVCNENGDRVTYPCRSDKFDYSYGPFGPICDPNPPTEATIPDLLLCCQPSREPNTLDNPICTNGYECCGLNGRWVCGEVKGSSTEIIFPCVGYGGLLDYSTGPFGLVCLKEGDIYRDVTTTTTTTSSPEDCLMDFDECYEECRRNNRYFSDSRVNRNAISREQRKCKRLLNNCLNDCFTDLNDCNNVLKERLS